MKIRVYKKLAIAILCILFLYPCAFAKAAQPAASPFAATGLLARPDESAEEILLRAHQLDARAIALAVVGYARGMGGFPRDPALASGWNAQLAAVNDAALTGLLSLMIFEQADFSDDLLSSILAACTLAQGSDLAPIFREKGLFDARPFCESLKKKKSSVPDWEKKYNKLIEFNKIYEKDLQEAIKAVRAFRDEPCSPQLQQDLNTAQETAIPETVVFYAATTHNPAKDAPDWSAERLLLFIDKLDSCERYENKNPAPGTVSAAQRIKVLARTAKEAIREIVSLDREKALSVIRSAHGLGYGKEHTDAVRSMAVHYRDGSLGFPGRGLLSLLWLQHAAFEFDNESRLLLAMEWFSKKQYAEAWAWADVIGKDKDADEKTKKLAAMLVAMIENQAGKDVRQDGGRLQALYFQATKALTDWLVQQDEREQ